MHASGILKLASLVMLGAVTACGAGSGGSSADPGLIPVPTSSWRPGDPGFLALAKGRLEGGYKDGRYCVWLTNWSGSHPVIWPAGYHLRLHPAELLDSHAAVVAKVGDQISFGGGAEPVRSDRTCMLNQNDALYVMGNVSAAHP